MNKSRKDNIEELAIQIDKLEDQSASHSSAALSLRQRRDELISQVILEDKLLSDTIWEIKSHNINDIDLILQDDPIDRPGIQQIESMIHKDNHCWFELLDGVELRISDGDFRLYFKEYKLAPSFIKKYNLMIVGAGIKDRLSKLKRDVVALEAICHQFNL